MSLFRNTSFLIVKDSCVKEELIDLLFFFRHNFNISLSKNILLVSSHSPPLPLVCAPPQLTLFTSLTTFRLCPFLSASPSTAVPFSRYTIYQRLQRQIHIFYNSRRRRDSHFRYPYTIQSLGVISLPV